MGGDDTVRAAWRHAEGGRNDRPVSAGPTSRQLLTTDNGPLT